MERWEPLPQIYPKGSYALRLSVRHGSGSAPVNAPQGIDYSEKIMPGPSPNAVIGKTIKRDAPGPCPDFGRQRLSVGDREVVGQPLLRIEPSQYLRRERTGANNGDNFEVGLGRQRHHERLVLG